MQFFRKRLFLLFAISVVYAAFFLTHLPQPSQQHVLGVSSNLILFEEPTAGKEPIITAINNAQKQIDVEVYLLSDKDVIASLVSACTRGLLVRVMLEEHPFGGGSINQKTQKQLATSCVHVQWTNATFSLTHEKTIVIDNQEVFILNQNLTTASFSSNREYDIVDGNTADVLEIENIFSADWERKSVHLSDNNLVVSPVSSRAKLSALIESATNTLSIESEVIDDPDIIHLLKEKAQKVHIEIIIPSFTQISSNKKTVEQLQGLGIEIKTIHSPYIHAKLILVDEKKAYIGSVNLTTQSMDSNREVGIVINQQDIIAMLDQDFEQDWQMGMSL